MHDAFGLQKSVGVLLLLERMRFDLIDRGLDFVVQEQILQAFVGKARHTDRTNSAFLVQALKSTPGGVVIAVRFMQEIEVNVVKTEFG